jgi:hypothetical protein
VGLLFLCGIGDVDVSSTGCSRDIHRCQVPRWFSNVIASLSRMRLRSAPDELSAFFPRH